MARPEKVEAVNQIKARLEGSSAVFVTEYSGLSVKEQQALRRGLRASGGEYKIVKMTLAKRAAAELELDRLEELLVGPTGIAFTEGDPVNSAKALSDFAGDHEAFVIKGGLLGRDFLAPERIRQLAEIEPREVLLAKIAGAGKAPLAKLAGLLSALNRNTANALRQLLEKKEQDAPVEAATEEPAAASYHPAESDADAQASQPEAADEALEDSAPAGDEQVSQLEAADEALEAAAEEPAAEAEAQSEEEADAPDDQEDQPEQEEPADAAEEE